MAEARGQLENPEERDRPSLEAVTRGLVKTADLEDFSACSCELQGV
jgi:hypothetical protein